MDGSMGLCMVGWLSECFGEDSVWERGDTMEEKKGREIVDPRNP